MASIRPVTLLLALALTGCIAEEMSSQPCPPEGTTLTYENFGRDFFSSHCVHCHGGPNGYSSRAFTTVESIRAQADRIYVNSARSNDAMPPGPSDISTEDRDRLGLWLTCGAP